MSPVTDSTTSNRTAPKVESFLWEGIDRHGKRRKGEINGNNIALVKAQLRRQGIQPRRVRRKPNRLLQRAGRTITAKDISILSRQLATMMAAGVPLVQAFTIIGRGHDNAAMRDLVGKIRADIEGGSGLADALSRHPRQFDTLTCNLIHAGEQAGILESMLDRIATYKEKSEALKAKVRKAMFYPAAVLVVAFVITAILLIFVIPQFQTLFDTFGGELPAITRLVIDLSALFQAWWWVIALTVVGCGYTLLQLKQRHRPFAEALDRLALRLPLLGTILHKSAVARFSRTLATMFAAGVPLVDALASVAAAAGNVVYHDAVLAMRDEVAAGTSLTESMQHTAIFPSMVVQMTAIGEEAGSLDTMLSKIADFYEEEVDNLVESLSSLMEPMIMAVLGVLIGGLVVAMYLPIFQMGSVV